MRKSYEEAIAEGVIKPVKDIKLSNDAKKTMKEGVIFDTFDADESNVAVAQINTIDVQSRRWHKGKPSQTIFSHH